jgi:acetyl esterase/lipase
MDLDPLVRRLIAASASPPFAHDLDPVDARQALRESQVDDLADFPVDATFSVAPVGPSGLVAFWLVRPAGSVGPLPVVVYVHGGLWMVGDVHTHSRLICDLVLGAGVAVMVPEYSRTPEARYPVAVEECFALVSWAVANAGELGLDAGRLAVAGDCAGATIATALTMLAVGRQGPSISGQLLYYPLTDERCDSASQREFAEGYLLTRRSLEHRWRLYVPSPFQRARPTASPLAAEPQDLRGLPAALVITAEADVSRDEGEQYAENLRLAGVDVVSTRYLGTVHDFVSLHALRDSPRTRAAVGQGVQFLRRVLGRPP